MAKLIHDAENNRCYHMSCRVCEYGGKDEELCTEKVTAEYLLNNGYRKASDVAREIFEEIERVAMSKIETDLSITALNDTYYIEAIDEVKKKYESEATE